MNALDAARPGPCRVLLIQARPADCRSTGQGIAPPLGLMSIAAAAREQLPGRLSFSLLDTYACSDAGIAARLGEFAPQVVAISGITAAQARMRALCRLVADAMDPAPRVVLGGPHATAYPADCCGFPGVDAVAIGEGEVPFVDFLRCAMCEMAIEDVRGIVRPNRTGIVPNEPAAPIADLDALPLPALDLMDQDLYITAPNDLATIMLPPHRYLPLFTSRGCPYRCTFCHNIFGKAFRARSMRSVLDEIADLSGRYGIRNFHIYDDIFNGRRRRMLDFCRGIEQRRLDLRFYFSNGLRVDKLDRIQLEAMRNAGVVYFGAAIESASERMQLLTRKRVDVERLVDNVAIADSLGIFTTGFMMVGIPGESRAEIQLTIDTACRSALHYAYFSVLNPYEGTAVAKEQKAHGLDLSPEQFSAGYSSSGSNFAGIPPVELKRILRDAYRRFWTPRRLLAFAARHPDPAGLAAALLSKETRRRLYSRIRGVLGAPPRPTEVGPDNPHGRSPEGVLVDAARPLAVLTQQVADRLHRWITPDCEARSPRVDPTR